MFDNISENKIKEYKSVFDLNDNNKDGNVTLDELANILKAINISSSDEEIKEIIMELELEGNDKINFANFVSIVNRRDKDVDNEEEVIKAFKF